MNQLLQMQSEDGKELLVYYYKKIQDVDEVILQLLNEAGLDGFIKSSVNKATSTINYNITGYSKWTELAAKGLTARYLGSALEDLYRLLAYLEDSFIDIEYVLLDTEFLFVDPETDKIQLVVIPCQSVVNEGFTLIDCVDRMFDGFSYHQGGEKTDQINAKLHRGIRSLGDLKELAELLSALEDEELDAEENPDEVFDLPDDFEETKDEETFSITEETFHIENEPEMASENEAETVREDAPEKETNESELEMRAGIETTSSKIQAADGTLVLEEIAKDAETPKQDEADLSGDAEFMRRQLREEMRRELEGELREKVQKDIRSEMENELREKIWAELSETFTQNMRHDMEIELREEIRQELEEEYAEKTKALEAEKIQEEAKQEENEDEKSSYLIRKKTGEIIQLNKQTFIIGKLDTCCDYVIRGNNAISRLHAVIKYREDSDSYFIVDCNSTNHTYLNGRRIEAEQPVELKDGMHIHLALEEFIFQLT